MVTAPEWIPRLGLDQYLSSLIIPFSHMEMQKLKSSDLSASVNEVGLGLRKLENEFSSLKKENTLVLAKPVKESVKTVVEKIVTPGSIVYKRVEVPVLTPTSQSSLKNLKAEFASGLQNLDNKLIAKILQVEDKISRSSQQNFQAIALSNKIDNLSGVTITNSTLAGSLSGLTDSVIPDDITLSTSNVVTVTSAATSTFSGGAASAGLASSRGLTLTGGSILSSSSASSTLANGINLTDGCFSVNGTCITSGGGGGGNITGSGLSGRATFWDGASSISSSASFLWDNTNNILTASNASTSRLSAVTHLKIGATATTTIVGDNGNSTFSGNLGIGTTTPGTPLSVTGAGVFTGPLTFTAFNATSTTATSTLSTGGLTVGANQLVVEQTSGNVGVGTSSPKTLLHLANSTPSLLLDEIDGPANFKIWEMFVNNGIFNINGRNDSHQRYDPALTINISDQVGIGTSTPYSRLTVWGEDTLTGKAFEVANNASTTLFTVLNNGRAGFGTSTPGTPLSVTGQAVITGTTTVLSIVATSTATSTFVGGVSVGGGLNVGCSSGQTLNGIGVSGGIVTSGSCAANASDIAEWYAVESGVEFGDIVAIGDKPFSYLAQGGDPENKKQVDLGTTTTNLLKKANDPGKLLGVISTAPYMTLGEDVRQASENRKPLALFGRVPVKVNLEGGSITVGDRIALSSVAGVGKKATQSGETIGVALEAYDSQSLKNQIMLFVDLRYYMIYENAAGSLSSNQDFGLDSLVALLKQMGIKIESGVISIVNLVVDKLITRELYVRENLEVGSSELPAGITLYDQITKEPYCVVVKNGELVNLPGKCLSVKAILDLSEAQSATTSSVSTTTPTISTTPEPTITIPEATSTPSAD